jgi:signal peptidase II
VPPSIPAIPRSTPARLPILALAFGLVLADQISKAWVLRHLPLDLTRPFLPGLLALQHVRNTGAAFSLFSGNPQLLGLVSLVVSAALLIWILSGPGQRLWLNLGLGFLFGGAAGNGIDRWRHGSVTDFLAFVPIQFPVFNLADVAINLALACFLLDQLLPRPAATGRPRRGLGLADPGPAAGPASGPEPNPDPRHPGHG